MPLQIVRNDITKMKCDAIVNAANSSLLGGGGVDGAIHKAAGPKLLAECKTLGGCKTGQAKITEGYDLPCKYVIHTVGPVWQGGENGEEELLRSCYRESLDLAKKKECQSVAFPLISAGAYGYPKETALNVAVNEISSFILENDMTVYIVVYDKSSFDVGKKLTEIKEYIDERYVDENLILRSQALNFDMPCAEADGAPLKLSDRLNRVDESFSQMLLRKIDEKGMTDAECYKKANVNGAPLKLSDRLNRVDESFSQMLLRKIDEKGMTDAECYKKANVSRKLFSKIRSDVNYKTSKTTAIAFAVALELDLTETKDLLMKAGFALSHSNKFDIIIEYFIEKGNYNIFEINETLFAFDQSLLGA